MTKDEFLQYLDAVTLTNDGIFEALMEVEPAEDRAECWTAAVRVIELTAQARGVRSALDVLPPLIMPGDDAGDARRFVQLLFPFGGEIAPHSLSEPVPVDFFQWQRALARILEQRQPIRDEARRAWLERCVADPGWQATVEELSTSYRGFVDLVEAAGYQERSKATLGPDPPAARARGGRPECGHVTTVLECFPWCKYDRESAYEAHSGWHPHADWVSLSKSQFRPRTDLLAACRCCVADHDRRPNGGPTCHLCAEALFWTTSALRARRWGGWFWLIEELRDSARARARESDPALLERELRFGIVWEGNEPYRAMLDRVRRFGSDPWNGHAMYGWEAGVRQIATVFLPVRVLSTDLRRDIQQRALALLNNIWDRYRLSDPKTTGRSDARQRQWDRYLSWLWQERVEGHPIDSIDAPSPTGPEPVTPQTIGRGIDRALRALAAL
ncbi:MAG: hypothetical protein R3C39_10300 [Dehalococcoidia bacterium]